MDKDQDESVVQKYSNLPNNSESAITKDDSQLKDKPQTLSQEPRNNPEEPKREVSDELPVREGDDIPVQEVLGTKSKPTELETMDQINYTVESELKPNTDLPTNSSTLTTNPTSENTQKNNENSQDNGIDDQAGFQMKNNPIESIENEMEDHQAAEDSNLIQSEAQTSSEKKVERETANDEDEAERENSNEQTEENQENSKNDENSSGENGKRSSKTLIDDLDHKSKILENSLKNRKKNSTEDVPVKDIKQCLTVSKKIILFGAVIPGQIKEQRLYILSSGATVNQSLTETTHVIFYITYFK